MSNILNNTQNQFNVLTTDIDLSTKSNIKGVNNYLLFLTVQNDEKTKDEKIYLYISDSDGNIHKLSEKKNYPAGKISINGKQIIYDGKNKFNNMLALLNGKITLVIDESLKKYTNIYLANTQYIINYEDMSFLYDGKSTIFLNIYIRAFDDYDEYFDCIRIEKGE